MKENFLIPPASAAEVVADGLRVIGVLGVVVAAVFLPATDAGILAFITPALVAPRFLRVRPGFDIVFCLIVLIAAWSNVADLYRAYLGWDTVVHVICTAVLAPMLYLLFARFAVVPAPGEAGFGARVAIIHTTTIGLAISALWEMVEWIGFELFTEDIYTTYDDTIGDMAAGGLGALVAGILLAAAPSFFDRPARGPGEA
jgi:hypothetical protein